MEELDITKFGNITGSSLVKLHNSKKLFCNYCDNLKDNNLIKLMRRANNLEGLNIYACESITIILINAAIEITKNRSNNVMLDIQIRENQIDYKKIKEKSPLLHLEII